MFQIFTMLGLLMAILIALTIVLAIVVAIKTAFKPKAGTGKVSDGESTKYNIK